MPRYQDKEYNARENRESFAQDPSPLEYRPDLKYDERERTAWDLPLTDPTIQTPPHHNDIGDGIATQVIKDYDDFKKDLQNKLDDLYNNLRGEPVEFPDYALDDIDRAKEELGIEGEFTFADYVTALENRNTAAGDYLTEISERYFEGLDGNIQMEVYHDYYELSQEIDIMDTYLHRQLNNHIFKEIDTKQEGWEDVLLKEEIGWKNQKVAIDKQRKHRDSIIKESFLYNPGVLEHQQNLKIHEEKDYKKKQNEYNQVKDTVSLAYSKLNESRSLFSNLEHVEVLVQEDELESTVDKIVRLSIEDNHKEENLTQFEQMLTVSTESMNNEKAHYKNSLRNVYNSDFLTHNLDELSLYNELYGNSMIPLTSVMKMYNKPQDDETSLFLETLSSTMLTISDDKTRKTKDFHKINRASTRLRHEKLKQTEEKERARRTYKVIDTLLDQIKEGGESNSNE